MAALANVLDDNWWWQSDRLAEELSSTLIELGAADVPSAVNAALGRMGEALSADRAALAELSDESETAAGAIYHWNGTDAPVVEARAHARQLLTLLGGQASEGGTLVLQHVPESLPIELVTPALLEHLREAPVRTAVLISVGIAGEQRWGLTIETARADRHWPPALVSRLRLIAEILVSALHRARGADALLEAAPASPMKGSHASAPTSPLAHGDNYDIVGDSRALRAVLAQVHEVVPTDSTVLLLGETGTGKELMARALHSHGPRHLQPLISVNCAALPPTLIESELFGYERGAFTGAVAMRPGRFQLAHRGTLFLDEIGDLTPEVQSKLLRVLQEGEFERLGSSQTQKVDVRIIAATHRDLLRAIAEGDFREDLFYRLNVFPVHLPSLRERRDDIPDLVWFFIRKRQRVFRRSIAKVPAHVMDILQRHDWPGNIRELENVIERALIHSTGDTLRLRDDRLESPLRRPAEDGTLNAVERMHIEEILRDCRWRINGTGNAAERLGLHPNTLRFRMKKLGIQRHAH